MSEKKFSIGRTGLLALAILVALGASAWAGNLVTLHAFNGTDGSGGGTLVWDGANHIFGAAFDGGHCSFSLAGCGTIYAMTHTSTGWKFESLYRFRGKSDGEFPLSIVIDAQLNVYGVTPRGGAFGKGTIFQVSRTGAGIWTETILYNFGAVPDDGAYPNSIAIDAAGNLYGTNKFGGTRVHSFCALGCGTVWQLTNSSSGWTESVLHRFVGGQDGFSPIGVSFDAQGNIYGTTESGPGRSGFGTVFQLSPPAVSGDPWSLSTLYKFTGGTDGGDPAAGVTVDASGNLFGTTATWGANVNGTVFEVSPSAGGWTFNVIRAFDDSVDGSDCRAGLVLDSAGNIYGTTSAGSFASAKAGAVFELSPAGGGTYTETVLHAFTGGDDGYRPLNGVILDSTGNIFGTTGFNGQLGFGTLFEITP
jgi:hypothetical protein